MSELPEWPIEPPWISADDPVLWGQYYEARAEAAIARLRVAAEALDDIYRGSFDRIDVRLRAHKVLAQIGKLPE